jgi:hypothetical protein
MWQPRDLRPDDFCMFLPPLLATTAHSSASPAPSQPGAWPSVTQAGVIRSSSPRLPSRRPIGLVFILASGIGDGVEQVGNRA